MTQLTIFDALAAQEEMSDWRSCQHCGYGRWYSSAEQEQGVFESEMDFHIVRQNRTGTYDILPSLGKCAKQSYLLTLVLMRAGASLQNRQHSWQVGWDYLGCIIHAKACGVTDAAIQTTIEAGTA